MNQKPTKAERSRSMRHKRPMMIRFGFLEGDDGALNDDDETEWEVDGHLNLSVAECVQIILDLIGDNNCRDCIFKCGDCGTCAITGYPPEPKQCMNESVINEWLGLVE